MANMVLFEMLDEIDELVEKCQLPVEADQRSRTFGMSKELVKVMKKNNELKDRKVKNDPGARDFSERLLSLIDEIDGALGMSQELVGIGQRDQIIGMYKEVVEVMKKQIELKDQKLENDYEAIELYKKLIELKDKKLESYGKVEKYQNTEMYEDLKLEKLELDLYVEELKRQKIVDAKYIEELKHQKLVADQRIAELNRQNSEANLCIEVLKGQKSAADQYIEKLENEKFGVDQYIDQKLSSKASPASGEKPENELNSKRGRQRLENLDTKLRAAFSCWPPSKGSKNQEAPSGHNVSNLHESVLRSCSSTRLKGTASTRPSKAALDDLLASVRCKKLCGPWLSVNELKKDLDEDLELCMNAVCVLYRLKISKAKSPLVSDRELSLFDALSGSDAAEYLISGDSQYRLRKSVAIVEEQRPDVIDLCRQIAKLYCSKLFSIYREGDDPLFKSI